MRARRIGAWTWDALAWRWPDFALTALVAALLVTVVLVFGCAGYPGNVPCPVEVTTYLEGGGGSAFGDRATDVRGGVSVTWDLTGEGGSRCAWDGGGS